MSEQTESPATAEVTAPEKKPARKRPAKAAAGTATPKKRATRKAATAEADVAAPAEALPVQQELAYPTSAIETTPPPPVITAAENAAEEAVSQSIASLQAEPKQEEAAADEEEDSASESLYNPTPSLRPLVRHRRVAVRPARTAKKSAAAKTEAPKPAAPKPTAPKPAAPAPAPAPVAEAKPVKPAPAEPVAPVEPEPAPEPAAEAAPAPEPIVTEAPEPKPVQATQPPPAPVPPRPAAPPEYGEGIVEVSGKGFGFIRDPSRGYVQSPQDIFVTPEVCRRYGLRDGQWIKGEIRRGSRGYQLFKLLEIDGENPDNCLDLPMFEELTVINPLERIVLETVPDRHTTRIIDMMAPVGKGQRGLIVAPPRTGKTTLLEHIAGGVAQNYPEMKLILLLVDERPEEVTELRRTCPTAELMASSNDSDVKSHCRIAQLAIERAKRLCEMGKDVFVLLDSLTRVGRAFNNATAGSGRTLSGGMDARAMEIPRRLFAAARNTEEAGSVTIVATALIETGSKMDELIFQEFKGTGNMELVLSRQIADMRTYPAVDIFLSGTRREELLIPADELHKINVIRRGLSGHKPMEAIERLLSFVRRFPTNSQMLRSVPG